MTQESSKPSRWHRATLALGKRVRRPAGPILAGASTLLGMLVGLALLQKS